MKEGYQLLRGLCTQFLIIARHKSERRSPDKSAQPDGDRGKQIRAGVQRRHGRPRRPPLGKRRQKRAFAGNA